MNTTKHSKSVTQELREYAAMFIEELSRFNPRFLDFLKGCDFDHAAMKSQDREDFTRQQARFLHGASEACYVEMDSRRVVTFKLRSPLHVSPFGETALVEIIEPRRELYGCSPTGFEHLEFFAPDQGALAESLSKLGIEFARFSYRHHQGILVKVGDTGRTVKFMDKKLRDVVDIETLQGESKELSGIPWLRGTT
jgi:predicted metalloenzyme YecM